MHSSYEQRSIRKQGLVSKLALFAKSSTKRKMTTQQQKGKGYIQPKVEENTPPVLLVVVNPNDLTNMNQICFGEDEYLGTPIRQNNSGTGKQRKITLEQLLHKYDDMDIFFGSGIKDDEDDECYDNEDYNHHHDDISYWCSVFNQRSASS